MNQHRPLKIAGFGKLFLTYLTCIWFFSRMEKLMCLKTASLCKLFVLFVCVEVLRPCQQLKSCRAGQLPINTVPGQA